MDKISAKKSLGENRNYSIAVLSAGFEYFVLF